MTNRHPCHSGTDNLVVKMVNKQIMKKVISVGDRRKQRGLTEKGFEKTRLLCLHGVVWEGFFDTMGRNQPGEELRKDIQISRVGFVCQRNRKEGQCDGILDRDGERHQGDW